MKTSAALFFIMILFPVVIYGQEISTLPKDKSDAIEKIILDVMDYQGIPGLSIAIVQNDAIVYAKGFGVKNIETSEPLTLNTMFHLASISKSFVAPAILKLASEKKINLEDPITKYLSNSTIDDADFRKVKIKYLLNHTSGVMSMDDHHWDKPEFDDKSLERYVQTREIKILSKPGEKFNYSDIGYELLAYVIEKASEMTFEEYMKRTFFKPLNMSRTTFLKTDFPDSAYASPHVIDYNACSLNKSLYYPYSRKHAASSTLQSTVIDMANYAVFNLNKGVYAKKRILNEGTYHVLWDTTAKANWSDLYQYYGAGWFTGTHKGRKVIHHSGNDNGFRAAFLLLPEEKAGIIIASNFYNARVFDLGPAIIDILVKQEQEVIQLADDINEFVGTYCKDSLFVKVYKENDKLYLSNNGEVYCLISSPYKGALVGKYRTGRHSIPYYDNSNIWLQKKEVDGNFIYTIEVDGLKFFKDASSCHSSVR